MEPWRSRSFDAISMRRGKSNWPSSMEASTYFLMTPLSPVKVSPTM
jgi:hypothetical protein